MEALLADLNDAQREAVTHPGGPLLVVAGAGSGKTRVVTRRIAWRVSQGTAPSRVLAITFTNKAAGEMRERVRSLVGGSVGWISTFHAFGARFLRMEAERASLDPAFAIYDAEDRLQLVRTVLEDMGLSPKDHPPRDYAQRISTLKRRGVGAPSADEQIDDRDLEVYRAYERALSECRALDFDDLLLLPVRLLREDEEVRLRWAQRFETVLVDEYQDTNRLQYELIRLLVSEHGDVCATGDPDQAIYRWRGADVRNILEFERDFPDARVIKLEENYRSTNGILRAASALITHNRQRYERALRSSLGEGEPVRVRAAWTEEDEARLVVDGIEEAVADGYSLDEIAVFYRTNACSRPLEQALRLRDVPYRIVGAVEFYERKEVKDLLSYLRLVAQPRALLDAQRVVNVPRRGIGPKTFAALKEYAERTGTPIRDVLLHPECVEGLRGPARRALAEFAEVLRDLLSVREGPVLDILDTVLDRTAYRDFVVAGGDPNAEERLENIEELRRAVAEYDRREPGGNLESFLAETALVRSRDRAGDEGPRVTLMTLHSAKGLEFPVVFVVALQEGILPHARCLDSEDALEEERRLLYVGMTRAMRRLTLSYSRARERGPAGVSLPSRFLREIPPDLLAGDDVGAPEAAHGWEERRYVPDYDAGEPPFQRGDRVAHERFGRGRVLDVRGWGPTAKVTVEFERFGVRVLLLEYAALVPASGEAE